MYLHQYHNHAIVKEVHRGIGSKTAKTSLFRFATPLFLIITETPL